MGILRAFNLPQVLGLMAPRKVVLIRPGHGNLNWPARVFQRLGCPGNFARAYDLRKASSLLLMP